MFYTQGDSMAKVTVSAETSVAPEQVWELVVNLPRVADWNSMHEGFTGDIPETLAEGATYKQKVKLMGMNSEMAWRVTVAQAPSRLEQVGDAPMGVKADNRIIVEPTATGSTVTLEMEFNGPALKGPMAMMVEKQAGGAAKTSIATFVSLLG